MTAMRHALMAIVTFGLAATPEAIAQPTPTPAPAPAPTPTPGVPDRVTVVGRVLDGVKGKWIKRATIAIEGTDVAARSDAAGQFSLVDVPIGALLVVTADGYEAALVTVEAAIRHDVVLMPIGSGEVIDVAGQAPAAAPGAASLDRAEVTKIPGTGNDVLAALDALPGVTSSAFGPTSFNGVVIRGSAPQDSKILVDGFEIPFLYHTIGFRSILPAESIEGLEYLPGGFDVAYGRASSGIVAVTTRGGDRRLGGQAEISVIDGGLLAHGPAGNRGTYLIALRRSTIDLILPSLIPDDVDLNLATVPRYYDLQVRTDFDLNRWKLAFGLIGSDDLLQLFVDDERDPDKRFYSRARFIRATAEARWAKDQWAATIAVSPVVQNLVFEFGRNQYFEMVAQGLGARTELTRTQPTAYGLTDVVTRVGAEVNIGRAHLDLALPYAPDEGEPMTGGPPDDDDIKERFTGVKWVPDVAAWTAASAAIGPHARLTTGLRVDGFLRSGDVAIQPRGELSVKLPRRVTARLAAGAYRRPPEYQDEFLDDRIHPERATQIVLGLEHGPTEGLKVQASGYYTDRTALLTRGDDGAYHNTGRGATVGAELLMILRRGPWFGWLSYSYSHSTRVDQPGARERLFDFDQPHDVNVALSWKGKKWQFGGRFKLTSGLPFTPVLGSVYDSDHDTYVPGFADVNSARVPAHHQVDIRIDRTFKLGRVRLSAFLDVQNVYLNESIAGYGYSFDYSERFAFKSIPILPSLGLRGEL
jgi:hypothetical protein